MNKRFKLASLAGAIALAMGSTAAFAAPPAAPAADQLPGQGKLVTSGTVSASDFTSGTGSITLTGNTVIDWGSGGADFNKGGTAGFNIGSDATLTFSGAFGVLNIDNSGNASQIMGHLNGAGNVFVANNNGIIVGANAQVASSGGNVSLIANTIAPGLATGSVSFDGSSVAYSGTGGNVDVKQGASISGATVLVSGGDTVNVAANALQGTSGNTIMAGVTSGGGAFAQDNPGAMVNVSGDNTSATSTLDINTAGNATVSGKINLNNFTGDGTLTNTGILNLAGTASNVDNEGQLTSTSSTFVSLTNGGSYDVGGNLTVTGGDLTNSGVITDAGNIAVTGGNLINNADASIAAGTAATTGTTPVAAAPGSVTVTNGKINNKGSLTNLSTVTTQSDASKDSFTAGMVGGINNAGSMSFATNASINVNQSSRGAVDGNDSTGNFYDSGTISVGNAGSLTVAAYNSIYSSGDFMANDKAVASDNALGAVSMTAGENGHSTDTSVMSNGSLLSITSPIVSGGNITLAAPMIRIMDDVMSTAASATAAVTAGAPQDGQYALRVAKGVTLSANTVNVQGFDNSDSDGFGAKPNLILQGQISGDTVSIGTTGNPVSDVFSGPTGGIMLNGSTSALNISFTGAVKTAKYLNSSNFRYNFLPVTSADSTAVKLTLDPVAYQTNGTSNGMSAVNILVDNAVTVNNAQDSGAAGAAITSGDTSVAGINTTPNTHLVLQSGGNITTDGTSGNFYWPGLIYLGTVSTDVNGNLLPGSYSYKNSIASTGDISNVIPGSTGNGGGIHFATSQPLTLGGNVYTNANSWVNFGTAALTQQYVKANASDGANPGMFVGGTVSSSGNIVNYDTLPADRFHTQGPDSSR